MMLTQEQVNIIRMTLEEWTPKTYTRGVFAVDINGKTVEPLQKEAVRWCVTGKISNTGKLRLNPEFDVITDILDSIADLAYDMDSVTVNDKLGYVEARLLLRMAIGDVCIP